MSIPPSSPIPELIDRLVAAIGDRQVKEVAAAIEVDAGYVRQWKRGRRPTRMNPDTRDRIVRYLGQPSVVREGAPVYGGSVDYLREALLAIREAADTALRRGGATPSATDPGGSSGPPEAEPPAALVPVEQAVKANRAPGQQRRAGP